MRYQSHERSKRYEDQRGYQKETEPLEKISTGSPGSKRCHCFPVPPDCHASGVSDVTQPLMNLKTLVISIIGAVGVIILAKNVMEFAQAYQQQDSSSMNSAIKGIVAGLIMAAISSVLTFLGIS